MILILARGDIIDLSGVPGITSLADVQLRAQVQGNNTVIDFGGGNTLTLANFTGALQSGNFRYGLIGDGNANTITGTAAAETLNGLGGNDTLQGLGGNDILDGGAGFDRAVYTDATAGITVNMAAGTAAGSGSGADTLVAMEAVSGTGFADSYTAVGFNAAVQNAPGIPTDFNEFEGLGGNDTITGNGDTRVSYLNAASGVTVDILQGTATSTLPGDVAQVGNDSFAGVSSVRASNFDDVLLGSNNPNNVFENFEGRGGADFIDGRGGVDRAIYSGEGAAATINLGAGTVTIGGVDDTLRSIEAVRGTNFDDVFSTGTYGTGTALNVGNLGTFNEFEGMGGNDQVFGNNNTRVSYLSATAGVDVNLSTGIGTSRAGFDAGVGTDTFSGSLNNPNQAGIHFGVNAVRGSTFGDILTGSNNGNNTTEFFEGWGGDDLIDGGLGFDMARYDFNFPGQPYGPVGIQVAMAVGTVSSTDAVTAALVGVDTLRNIESVRGTNSADSFNAAGYTSIASLGVANPSANASAIGSGFNEFEGMGGDDTIAGNGNTRISYQSALAGVDVSLARGTGLGIEAGDVANVGTDTFQGATANGAIHYGISTVRGSNFADILTGSDNGTNTTEFFEGFGGNDTINGGLGFDQARYDNAPGPLGSAGMTFSMASGIVSSSDTLTAAAFGTDTLRNIESIRGSNLADIYDATGYTFATVSSGTASANVNNNGTGNFGFNEFEGGGGNDTITGNGNTRITFVNASGGVSVDLVAGTASGDGSVGNDIITGGVSAIRGSNFADTLFGSGGNNTIQGQNGDDRIEGRGGNDQLTGGTGNDTFVFNTGFGIDTITDFQAGDIIEFSTSVFADYAALQAQIPGSIAATVTITAGAGNSITLTNLTTQLTANDFHFV